MALSRSEKQKLLQKMRETKAKKGGGFRDPNEWRPKFEKDKDLTYRIHILPPLLEGDECIGKDGKTTKCEKDWDLYYYQRGGHFINKKIHECPRVRDGGECPMCSIGFDLMRESDDKEVRKQIAKEWLSQESHVVNIYFPDHKDNPSDLRGNVMYWRLPMAIFRQCEDAFDRDDDGGDDDDPLAFGLFFDPEESFPIKITLREKAGYNNYDDSKLLGKSRALADSESEIEEILAKRIDVPERYPKPDIKELQKIADAKMSGDTDGSSGFDEDDNSSKENKKVQESKEEPESKDDSDGSEEDEKKKKKEEALKKQREAKKKREEAAKKEAEESKDDDDDDDDDGDSKSKSKSKDDDDDDELDPEMAALLEDLA